MHHYRYLAVHENRIDKSSDFDTLGVMKWTLSRIAYIAINIVALPILLLCIISVLVKRIFKPIPAGISLTAFTPLSGRLALHKTGAREDEAVNRLYRYIPGLNYLATQILLGIRSLAMGLSRYTPLGLTYPAPRPSNFGTFINHRTEFFDKALHDYLDQQSGGLQQLVILGAGWDTRVYNLPDSVKLKLFEVDRVAMQSLKRQALNKAGFETGHVSFVSCDFNTESWIERLIQSGFDPDLPTFFLWEGVSYYLTEDAALATLDTMSSQCAKGSAIAFDYASKEIVDGVGPKSFQRLMKNLERAGEPWLFGVSTASPARERVAELLAEHHLALARYEPCGAESDEEQPFVGLVVAESE